jgi:hypothetical protein
MADDWADEVIHGGHMAGGQVPQVPIARVPIPEGKAKYNDPRVKAAIMI